MAFRLLDRTADTGTYDSTPTPKEIDLDGAGISNLRTFAEAVADGDFADGDETLVSLVDTSGNWATYEATYVAGTPNKLELDSLVSDEGTIADEAAVDVYVAVNQKYLKENLKRNAVAPTTGNVTAEVGYRYSVDLSGLTADRNFTLPSGDVGDCIELYVTDAAPTAYELIIIGDTGVTVNGGTAATEWSRLLQKGERLKLILDTTTNWIVVADGRKPTSAQVYGSFNHTSNGSYLVFDFSGLSTDHDTGSLIDTANDRFTVRRSGTYTIGYSCYCSLSATKSLFSRVLINSATLDTSKTAGDKAGSAAATLSTFASITEALSAGDHVQEDLYQNDSSSETLQSNFYITEIIGT